jgi:N-methylhydantoinase A
VRGGGARLGHANEREHSHRRDGSPVELYRINLRAVGSTQKAELARHDGGGAMPGPAGTRVIHFGAAGAVESPVYRRADLPAGAAFEGPAVIEQLDSTVLVPPGVRTEVDEWLNIRMAIDLEASA